MNILAVKNMVEIAGLDNCYKYLKNFQFTTLVDSRTESDGRVVTDKGPATALGGLTDGVSVLETTAAYGTIANGGEYLKPHFYSKVLDHNGDVLLEYPEPPIEVLKRGSAYILTDMMTGVITDPYGTGKMAGFKNVYMPIAGKTGTTTDTKDLTFVGYTPYLVAGIWVGFDFPKTMNVDNTHYHVELWRDIMESIHDGMDYAEFEKPQDDIVEVEVCMDSSLLAGDLCKWDGRGSRVTTAIYAKGTEPTETCDVHASVTIDVQTGMKATQYCPSENKRTITGIIVADQNVTDWTYQIPSSVYNGAYCIYHGPSAVENWATDEPEETEDPGYEETPPPSDIEPTETYEPQTDPEFPEPPTDVFENPPANTLPPDPEIPIVDEPTSIDDFIITPEY
jgi:penicillin-binding protein 1A